MNEPTKQQKAKFKRAINKIVEANKFYIMNCVWHNVDCETKKVKAGQFHIGVNPLLCVDLGGFENPNHFYKDKKRAKAIQQMIMKEFESLPAKFEQAGLAKNCEIKTCYGGKPFMQVEEGIVMDPIFN